MDRCPLWIDVLWIDVPMDRCPMNTCPLTSVTNSLTDLLTDYCLVDLIYVTLVDEDAYTKVVDVVADIEESSGLIFVNFGTPPHY